MTKTPPIIDLSTIWNRLEPKEAVPFSAEMVLPTDGPAGPEPLPGSGRLLFEIRIFGSGAPCGDGCQNRIG